MILFASLSLWFEGSTLDILFRILAGETETSARAGLTQLHKVKKK